MANTNTTSGYTEAFYDAYTRGYEAILQERKFFWAGTMRMEPLQGENQSYDFVSSIELTEKTTRFDDVPVEDMTHNRRWISPRWFRKAIFKDDEDQVMLQADPTSDYIQALAMGAIRKQNSIGTESFFGTVRGGIEPGVDRAGTATTYAYVNTAIAPGTAAGGRTIPHDSDKNGDADGTSTGLTIDKMIIAKEAFIQMNNDPDETMYMAIGPRQQSDLLRAAETQSSDTSNVKSLQTVGQVADFMGFKFIVTNQIAIGSSNDIDSDTNVFECPIWTKMGMLFAMHKSPIFKVDWIPRKQIWQIYSSMGANAIRMDEDKVIKMECAAV